MKITASLTMLAILSGCTSAQLSTANDDAKIAANVIAMACQYAPQMISVAQNLAKGGAASTVAQAAPIVAASCTVAGQAALAANDKAPAGPGNSGNSAAWLMATAANALVVAAQAAK